MTFFVSPERFPGWDVSTLEGAATLGNRYALISAQHKALITCAGLHTGAMTLDEPTGVGASGRTGAATEVKLAVGWTLRIFGGVNENCVLTLVSYNNSIKCAHVVLNGIKLLLYVIFTALIYSVL